MLDAAMKMARKRAMDRAGKRRPTQRLTAQQRAGLAARRGAAQARSRGSRGRNLRRRISGGMGRRTLRRR